MTTDKLTHLNILHKALLTLGHAAEVILTGSELSETGVPMNYDQVSLSITVTARDDEGKLQKSEINIDSKNIEGTYDLRNWILRDILEAKKSIEQEFEEA